jgi:hypothetical protein
MPRIHLFAEQILNYNSSENSLSMLQSYTIIHVYDW